MIVVQRSPWLQRLLVNMGRPRIVRTPSEERERKIKRKEARRARIRAQTEEQRAVSRSKHAELQRRRRQDAALREREAEERRLRRQDPVIRYLEAAKHRARREDAAVREREAEAKRQRRQDPAVRQQEAYAHRARRQDAAVREREAEANRRRRQDPAVRRQEADAHRARREDAAVRERETEARRQRRLIEHTALFGGQIFNNPFGYACDVCRRLGFKADLSPICVPHVPLLSAAFPTEDVPSFMLCSTCHSALEMGTIPVPHRSTSDDEDLQSALQILAKEIYSKQNAQEGKVDCCLQTDGTGKTDCFVQTEDASKKTFEVPTVKCVKIAAVQTEECPELKSHRTHVTNCERNNTGEGPFMHDICQEDFSCEQSPRRAPENSRVGKVSRVPGLWHAFG
ncbi:uncharacterized protein [Dermacentor andersoni]|uniref:uncharacterized protein isoform X1 n=1 Tax=Dermacentor andersoni TaxID=34620 RepID=UPI002415DB33|nr:uncharacterized protein LOC126545019 isoform X1 [Dermacentor andersoni]